MILKRIEKNRLSVYAERKIAESARRDYIKTTWLLMEGSELHTEAEREKRNFIGRWKGSLYFENLREYIEDEPAYLEIWRTGNHGEIGASFESSAAFLGLQERGHPPVLEQMKMHGCCKEESGEGEKGFLWLEAATGEMTVRIDGVWNTKTGPLLGVYRRTRKTSPKEVVLCLQMDLFLE